MAVVHHTLSLITPIQVAAAVLAVAMAVKQFNDNVGSGYPNYTTNGPNHSTFAAYGDTGGQASGIGNNNPPRMGFGGKQRKGVTFYRPDANTFSYVFSYRAEAGGCAFRSASEDQTSLGGDLLLVEYSLDHNLLLLAVPQQAAVVVTQLMVLTVVELVKLANI